MDERYIFLSTLQENSDDCWSTISRKKIQYGFSFDCHVITDIPDGINDAIWHYAAAFGRI